MANIPLIIILSILCGCSFSFRVLPLSENPDLVIDEELNLVEPKTDFWHIMFRPKTKSSFKNIVKLINSFDSRNKYTVGKDVLPSVLHLPAANSEETEKHTTEISHTQLIIQVDRVPEIVSDETAEKEGLSEENSRGVSVESINVESKSENTDDEQAKNSSSAQEVNQEDLSDENSSARVLEEDNEAKAVQLMEEEAVRYEPKLPQSLHHFENEKPRYQHSFRDGWIY